MTSVRKLEIRIDQTGSAGKGIKGIAGSLGKLTGIGLAAGAAAVGGVALLTGAILKLGSGLSTMGADAEEMEAKFDVVFGEGAPAAKDALDEFGDTVGRNKFALMEMASTIQDTFVPMGFARDEAAGLAIDMTKLAVDVGSFNNELAPDVLDAFQSAIVGNHETVRQFGIVITQAALDTELLSMGVAGGIKEATEMEKVQARLNLIIAGTADAQGDATATAGSWTNSMLGVKEAVAEGATEMGLMLNEALLPLLQEFGPWVKDLIPKAVEIFGEFADKLSVTVGPAMILIKDAINRIAEAFGINTEEVSSADAILSIFSTGLDGVILVIQLGAIAMQGLAAAVEGVKSAIGFLIDKWGGLKRAAQDAIDAIPAWLRPGSPTPFEMGLRGIGDAMKDVDLGGLAPGAGAALGGAVGAGQGITVNLTYAPAVSLADRFEAEEKLAPFIANALRTQLGVA